MASVAELPIPIILFAWIAFAFWGAGRLLVRLISPKMSEQGIFLTFPVYSALGMGAAGQAVFLMGCLGSTYRKDIVAGFFAGLSLAALIPFFNARKHWRAPKLAWNLSWVEAVVVLITAICLLRWFWILTGFPPGSDVFNHHYAHAKDLIRLGRFGHIPRLPDGFDQISNYNPAVMHLLYMAGMILWDERVCNLLHWLTQVQLVILLYGIGAKFSGRGAGLMAVAAYMGMGLQGEFPLDVQDYTYLAVMMMTAVYVLLLYRESGRLKDLILAAVAAGLMMSVKYHGLILMAPLTWLAWMTSSGSGSRRLGRSLLFGLIALAVFSPWLAYNLVAFGDPVFPFLSNPAFVRIYKIEICLHTIASYVAPADSTYWLPRCLYYVSMFLPFERDLAVAGLSPIFLLGIPCSLYCWSRTPGYHKTPEGLLFILYLSGLILLELLAGRAFFKWGLFPGCAYSVSLALMASQWTGENKKKFWAMLLFVLGINYEYNIRVGDEIHAPVYQRAQRWSPMIRYLNENLEAGAGIGNINFLTSFYLRPDIRTYIRSENVTSGWKEEENLLSANRIGYYMDYLGGDEKLVSFHERMLRLSKQLRRDDAGDQSYLRRTIELFKGRTLEKVRFLERRARVVKKFDEGAVLYRISPRSG